MVIVLLSHHSSMATRNHVGLHPFIWVNIKIHLQGIPSNQICHLKKTETKTHLNQIINAMICWKLWNKQFHLNSEINVMEVGVSDLASWIFILVRNTLFFKLLIGWEIHHSATYSITLTTLGLLGAGPILFRWYMVCLLQFCLSIANFICFKDYFL